MASLQSTLRSHQQSLVQLSGVNSKLAADLIALRAPSVTALADVKQHTAALERHIASAIDGYVACHDKDDDDDDNDDDDARADDVGMPSSATKEDMAYIQSLLALQHAQPRDISVMMSSQPPSGTHMLATSTPARLDPRPPLQTLVEETPMLPRDNPSHVS